MTDGLPEGGNTNQGPEVARSSDAGQSAGDSKGGILKRLNNVGAIRSIRAMFGSKHEQLQEAHNLPTVTEPITSREIDREHPDIIPVIVRDASGNVNEAATATYRNRMLDAAKNMIDRMRLFDAQSYPELGNALDIVTQAAREHILAKLTRLRLPLQHFPIPYFVTSDPDPEGIFPVRGYVDAGTGLQITIVEDSNPEQLLHTAANVVHESEHGSVGLDVTESEPQRKRVGHERWEEGRRGQAEGGMLENASALIGAAETYETIKAIPYFQEAARARETYVASATGRKVSRERNDGSENDRLRRIVSMKKLGIPPTFIESVIEYTGNGNIDQLVAMWKIMRIVGKSVATEIAQREGRTIGSDEYFAIGRDFMETSRYTGSDVARDRIQELFGEEGAGLILKAPHNPNQGSSDDILNVLRAIKVTEEREGVSVKMHSKLGDFDLY